MKEQDAEILNGSQVCFDDLYFHMYRVEETIFYGTCQRLPIGSLPPQKKAGSVKPALCKKAVERSKSGEK